MRPWRIVQWLDSPAVCGKYQDEQPFRGKLEGARFPPAALELLVSPRTIAGARKITSFDDPRAAQSIGLLFLLFPLPHSVSAALSTTDLLSMGGLPVLLPRFPLPPLRGFVAAMLAAVTRQWMLWPENTAAAFKQTQAASWSANTFLLLRNFSFSLIFEMS
jgi:hypothetical protein